MDEHYESLRRHILDLGVRLEAIELHLKRQDQAIAVLTALLSRKVDGMAIAEVDIPEDLRKFFPS